MNIEQVGLIIDALSEGLDMCIVAEGRRQRIEELEAKLEAAHDEIKWLTTKSLDWLRQWNSDQEQLAAQALQIKELREALELAERHFIPHNWKVSGEALSKPYSDEALRKHVAGEMRKHSVFLCNLNGCKQELDEYADRYEKGEA